MTIKHFWLFVYGLALGFATVSFLSGGIFLPLLLIAMTVLNIRSDLKHGNGIAAKSRKELT